MWWFVGVGAVGDVVVDVDVELFPLVVAAAAVVEPPAAGVPGRVAACCATSAEFRRGLRVEVPVGKEERKGEEIRIQLT